MVHLARCHRHTLGLIHVRVAEPHDHPNRRVTRSLFLGDKHRLVVILTKEHHVTAEVGWVGVLSEHRNLLQRPTRDHLRASHVTHRRMCRITTDLIHTPVAVLRRVTENLQMPLVMLVELDEPVNVFLQVAALTFHRQIMRGEVREPEHVATSGQKRLHRRRWVLLLEHVHIVVAQVDDRPPSPQQFRHCHTHGAKNQLFLRHVLQLGVLPLLVRGDVRRCVLRVPEPRVELADILGSSRFSIVPQVVEVVADTIGG